MIFFDLDETLFDFKTAEYLAVKTLYTQFAEPSKQTENEFYLEWCTIGKRHFDRYLLGELSFEQQKIQRIIEVFSGLDIEVNDDNAMIIFRFI